MNTILLVIIAVIFIAILTVILRIVYSVKKFSRDFLGTSNPIAWTRMRMEESEEEPKSVSAMTGFMLEKIKKDFPEFNWYEFKDKINRQVKEFVSDKHSANADIHRTEISNYSKNSGNCIIYVQTSAGFDDSGHKRRERRYNTSLIYIQDINKLPSGQAGFSLCCPSCGAPVKSIGSKVCSYCGSPVRELNIKVWEIGDTEEE